MANQRGESTSIGHFWNRCIDAVNNLFETYSFWTHASDVEFDDGEVAQNKVGAINGITSDLSCEDESIAVSAKAVNDSLGGCEFSVESDGAYVTYTVGADTVTKKLGDIEFYEQRVTTYGGNVWQEYTLENPPKNGIIVFFSYDSRVSFYLKDIYYNTDIQSNMINYTFGDATIKLGLNVSATSYSVTNTIITF